MNSKHQNKDCYIYCFLCLDIYLLKRSVKLNLAIAITLLYMNVFVFILSVMFGDKVFQKQFNESIWH